MLNNYPSLGWFVPNRFPSKVFGSALLATPQAPLGPVLLPGL